ncbi:MAG: hypothetical protein JWO94_1373 [Verrucomicrobiaceae bacterium]|nr:hypothetical protein [Verrucomicrobiaceae bacterium]
MKFLLCHAALCLFLVTQPSCKRLDERMVITDSRDVSALSGKAAVDIPSSTRFFDETKPQAASTAANLRDFLTWKIPEGWNEATTPDPTGMRTVDLRFGPTQEGECYVSLMPGPAGGRAANINRWRTQMGQPPYTEEELEKLEKKSFFAREADFVAFDGDYKAVGAPEPKKGYRLLGLIHSAPQATIFVKLIGPKALVEQNSAAFDAFCKSIRPDSEKLPKQ